MISKERKKVIEEIIMNEMIRENTPGLSIGIVQNINLVYATGFGSRDYKKKLSATEDTLYGIASITKSFIALGIMKLVEAQKLQLFDSITKYIPIESFAEKITIHHLLSHTSGVPNIADGLPNRIE